MTAPTTVTIGLDVSDRVIHACVLDHDGTRLEECRLRTTRQQLADLLRRYPRARTVLEAGSHSPWMSRQLHAGGHEVVVANSRRVQLIAQSDRKTDRQDARQLAELGRFDPTLLAPITHRSEEAQHGLALLRVRDALVRNRTSLINQARGLAKALGERLPACGARVFPARVRRDLGGALFPGFTVLLAMIERLNIEIRALEREVEELCHERYPVTARLRQIPGVGAITALAFVLTIDDPHRFSSSRKLGAYLGLRPRQRASGERDPQLPITKAGCPFLRKTLIQAAHHILGPRRPDTSLRRHGLKIAQRGGTAAKKRAVVAVARKLSVLLHHLWVSGATYQPLLASDGARS
jgi:transposase